MIHITKTDVFGWESAIRGMRNPMNSWDKSDSGYIELEDWKKADTGETFKYVIGPNDLKLMKSLSKAGSDHGKFLRMINVTCDINAPLYWWKEYDTYKVGTVANSCSTMHKIHAKKFTMDDFSHEHLSEEHDIPSLDCSSQDILDVVIEALNRYRNLYLEADNKLKNRELTDAERKHITAQRKHFWWQMIQLLPSSYNQRRTVQLNYQVLKSMYNSRKSHKLDEWRHFCVWCEGMPHFKEICLGGDSDEK